MFKLLLVSSLLVCLASAGPVKQVVDINSICEQGEFKYFQPHPYDQSKYIQCNPWGTGVEKSCESGLVWNMWSLICDSPSNIRNMTVSLPKSEQVNCTSVGLECLNGGVCMQTAYGNVKCDCRPQYTGEFCETEVDLTDLSHEILNGTFSVRDYKRRLIEANITVDMTFYQRYRDQLDKETYAELMNYLSLYNSTDIRYDTLVNNLVEDILEDIYPDAEYLSSFNASAQSVVTMVRLIPSLLSYSRYSFERYEDVFDQYERVLSSLVRILNSTVPTIRSEATRYSTLTSYFMNQTMALVNQTMASENKTLVVENQSVDSLKLNDRDVKESLRLNYNTTLINSEKLVEKLEKFQMTIVEMLRKNPSVTRVSLGECKTEGAKETLQLFNEISIASTQIWDSLVNYGFWFITNMFSNSQKMANFEQALEKF